MEEALKNFFGEASVGSFLLVYMTATTVTGLLSAAIYRLLMVWWPTLNGRAWPTVTAVMAAATTIFYWMVYEKTANPIEYLAFASFVMWSLLYLSTSNAKSMLAKINNMIDVKKHED